MTFDTIGAAFAYENGASGTRNASADIARTLELLHMNGVTEITYGKTSYLWDDDGNGHSRWKADGTDTTLVSAIMTQIMADIAEYLGEADVINAEDAALQCRSVPQRQRLHHFH